MPGAREVILLRRGKVKWISPVLQRQLTNLVLEWNHHCNWSAAAARAGARLSEKRRGSASFYAHARNVFHNNYSADARSLTRREGRDGLL